MYRNHISKIFICKNFVHIKFYNLIYTRSHLVRVCSQTGAWSSSTQCVHIKKIVYIQIMYLKFLYIRILYALEFIPYYIVDHILFLSVHRLERGHPFTTAYIIKKYLYKNHISKNFICKNFIPIKFYILICTRSHLVLVCSQAGAWSPFHHCHMIYKYYISIS